MQIFTQKTSILLIPGFLIIGYFIFTKIAAFIKSRRIEELLASYHKDRIIYFSKEINYFGQKSAGRTQMKINGSLLLTSDQLHFLRWIPKKEIVIPLANIENIDRVNSFLGKNKKSELLRIDYNNQQGEKDSAAWHLDNMNAWEQVIKDNID